MRRSFGLISLAALTAAAFAGLGVSGLLADYAKSINGARSLSTAYVLVQVGGTTNRYTVDLKKPNLARLDEPDRTVVADGTNITTFVKADKVFYKQPETDEALKGLFQNDALNPWAGFFTPDAYKPTASRDIEQAQSGSDTFPAVEAQYGPAGVKTVTYFLDPSDKVTRREKIVEENGNDKTTTVLRTSSLTLNGAQRTDLYAFTAPEGAQAVSYAEMMGAKWYTDITEAKAAAKASGRKIFVDFFATWCGPCQDLEDQVLDTSQFKKLASSELILCRIDVDAQADVAKDYSIDAMPTQMVLDSNGNLVNKMVGYGGPDMFYQFLNSSLG